MKVMFSFVVDVPEEHIGTSYDLLKEGIHEVTKYLRVPEPYLHSMGVNPEEEDYGGFFTGMLCEYDQSKIPSTAPVIKRRN